MRVVRSLLCWVFFAAAMGAALGMMQILNRLMHPNPADQPDLFGPGIKLLAFFALPAVVFAAAWWTTLRDKRSARGWGLAASVLILLIALAPLAIFLRGQSSGPAMTGNWQVDGVIVLSGVLGLVAYGRRFEPKDAATVRAETSPNKGDGTFALLNQFGVLLAPAVVYIVYSWWLGLMRERGLWTGFDMVRDNVAFFAILAAMVVVHELGHAAAISSLPMQFTLFALGPFELKREEGRWRVKFSPKKMLRRAGAVAAVPMTVGPPRWHGACIAAAGPAASVLGGAVALAAGQTMDFPGWPMLGGYLVLFGVMSFAFALLNLIPLRVGSTYSDGARLYQHLATNPFCDLVRVREMVMSVLDTPVRPRDYDLTMLERALAGHADGVQGHYLKLYEHEYYVENGEPEKARKALEESEAIYDKAGLKAETEVTFILGYAGLYRNGESARRWWERLEARQADRTKSGYWMAKSAFDCVEGRLDEARAALRQAEELTAAERPSGSRAFDEDWMERLRHAIDEAAMATAEPSVGRA